jgi:hypothetical protein
MKKALALATAACALAGAGFAFAGLTANKTVNIRSTALRSEDRHDRRWRHGDVEERRHREPPGRGEQRRVRVGQIAPNRIYAKRIDTPGTYGYHDALHPTLKGTVKVTGAPPSVSIAASTPIADLRKRDPRRRARLAGRSGQHGDRLRAAVRQRLVREALRRPDDDERRLGPIVTPPQLLTS